MAGAFRVGGGEGAGGDGDFVLIGQGRHVLSNSCYRDLAPKKEAQDKHFGCDTPSRFKYMFGNIQQYPPSEAVLLGTISTNLQTWAYIC